MTEAVRHRSVRCSALPLVRRCAQSAAVTVNGVAIDAYNDAATLGSAVHEAMEAVVRGDDPDITDIADRWGADAEEVERLVGYGRWAWREVSQWFPNPETEVSMEAHPAPGLTVTGHADVVSHISDEHVAILDYKTGWALRDYQWQLMGYALLAAIKYPKVKKVTICVLHLRHGEALVRHLSLGGLLRFEGELANRLLEAETSEYAPGEHCQFCPRFGDCPALREMIRNTIVTLEATHETGLDLVSLERNRDEIAPTIAKTLAGVKVVAAMCESFKKMVKANVERFGPLPDGEGKKLAIITKNIDEIDTARAWPVLLRNLDETQIASVIKITKGKALDAIADGAERGDKGKRKQDFLDQLAEAGALRSIPRRELRLVNDTDTNKEESSE